MRWSDISFTPDSKTLRQFSGLWIVFFAGIAAWQGLVRGNMWAAIVIGAVAPFGILGLVRPQLMRPIYVGWMVVAFPIGWLVSHTILALIYYGVFTPLGLFFRLIGRDALTRNYAPKATTYWVAKQGQRDARSYFRQF